MAFHDLNTFYSCLLSLLQLNNFEYIPIYLAYSPTLLEQYLVLLQGSNLNVKELYLFSDFAFVINLLSTYFPKQTTWYNLHKTGKANWTLALKYKTKKKKETYVKEFNSNMIFIHALVHWVTEQHIGFSNSFLYL